MRGGGGPGAPEEPVRGPYGGRCPPPLPYVARRTRAGSGAIEAKQDHAALEELTALVHDVLVVRALAVRLGGAHLRARDDDRGGPSCAPCAHEHDQHQY